MGLMIVAKAQSDHDFLGKPQSYFPDQLVHERQLADQLEPSHWKCDGLLPFVLIELYLNSRN